MTKLSKGRVLGVVALAFVLGGGLGRYLGNIPETDSPSDAAGGAQALNAVHGAKGGTAAAAGAADESKLYSVPVSMSQPKLGPEDALVTMIEWCDLPDPACAAIEPAVQALLKSHPTDVRLLFRHYLDPARPDSVRAHQFARIAHEQGGKFWEARALLLAHKGEVTMDVVEGFSKQLGLDWEAVRKGFDDGGYGSHVTADRIFGEMFEVTETPTFFINGRALRHPSAPALTALVNEEIEHARKVVASGVPKADLYATLVKKGTWVKPARFAAQ